MVVLNMSNATLTDYALGFPAAGQWALRFDSHAAVYSPDYKGQVSGDVTAEDGEYDGLPAHGKVNLGPYAALIFSQNLG